LLDRLEKRNLCVRVSSPEAIVPAANKARERNHLICVICDAETSFDEMNVEESWQDIPIALIAPTFGKFRNVSRNLALFKKLNLRVYLPCDEGGLVGARLLASLGIPTGIVFDKVPRPDWEALADLMTYALLGMAAHAPIEPFQTMADCCRQGRSEDWGRAIFDDPSSYLHIDAMGRTALSRRELIAGEFVAQDLSELDTPVVAKAVANRRDAWQKLFLDNHFCARCGGWRLCRGRFADGRDEPDDCGEFFQDMMDVIEQSCKNLGPQQPVEKWRP